MMEYAFHRVENIAEKGENTVVTFSFNFLNWLLDNQGRQNTGWCQPFTTQSQLLIAFKKKLLKTLWENAGDQHFFLFSQCF